MQEQLIPIGILVILVGFALVVIGSILTAFKGKAKTEWGFFGLIGPFPIGAWSGRNVFIITIVIAVIFLLFFVLLNLIGR